MATNTERLYSALSERKLKVGDSAYFAEAMRSPERRKNLYNYARSEGFDLGDFDAFESRLASDFEVPEPAAPAKPRDPEAERVRDLISLGSSEGSLDPAAAGGPILSAAPAPRNRKIKAAAMANDEIDRMYLDAVKRGERYISPEDFVRRKLNGENRPPELVEDPGAVISGAVSNLRRSRLWKPVDVGSKAVISGLLTPGRLAPSEGESILGNASTLASADLFQNLRGAADDVAFEADDAAVDRVNAQARSVAGADNTAIPVAKRAPRPGLMESVSGLAKQVADDPLEASADLLGAVFTPENLLSGVAVSGPVLGAVAKTASGLPGAARARRILGNPGRQLGIRTGVSPSRELVRDFAQGVGAEYLGTGEVSTQGAVENLIPAMASTPIMRGVDRILEGKPKTAIAPGGDAIGAAPRTTTVEPPAQPQAAAEPPNAPEPTPSAARAAEPPPAPEPTIQAPEPPAPAPAAPVQDMAAVEATRRKAKMSPGLKEAASLSRRESNIDRRVARDLAEDAKKVAEDLTRKGMYDDAKAVIERSRERFAEAHPGLGDDFVKGYKDWIDKERAAAEAKAAEKAAKKAARKSKTDKPKTATEAQATVERAVAEGTPEAIEAARPAIEALAPVTSEADELAAKLKADAEAKASATESVATPESTPSQEPAAPEPETQKAAPEERPIVSDGKKEYQHPSQEDWDVTPLDASKSAASIWGDANTIAALREKDANLATRVKRSATTLYKRQNQPLGLDGEPAIKVIDEAQAILAESGTTMDDYLDLRGSELDDWLKEKGIPREELHSAYVDSQATAKEQADFIRAAAVASGDNSQILAAKRDAAVVLGSGILPPDILSHAEGLLAQAKLLTEGGIRTADKMNRAEQRLASRPEWADAHAALRDLNLAIRKFDEEARAKIARLKGPIIAALNDIPFEYFRPSYMKQVTDALEGKDVKLDVKQQALHDAIRAAFDENGRFYTEVTGNPMRENWVHRSEDRTRVSSAVRSIQKEFAPHEAGAILEGESMTVENSKKIPAIKDPLAAEAVNNYAAELEKLFEIKDGKVVAVQKDGIDLIDSEAAYLKLMDDAGDLPTFLPEILEKKATPRDGRLEMGVVVRAPESQRDWTPEDLKSLLRGEAARLLYNRHNYDPEMPKPNRGKHKYGNWQADGSLLYRRILPSMGESFYVRDPVVLADESINRQTRGLARIRDFGQDRGAILDALVKARGAMSDAELGIVKNADGTFRLATIQDGPLYEKSLLRDYEDVAMGYMRPFTPDNQVYQALGKVGATVRSVVLLRKFGTTLNNEINGISLHAQLGPEAVARWIATRLGVAFDQQDDAMRRIGSRVARTVKARNTARKWLSESPMTRADEAALNDVGLMMGGDRWDRWLRQVDRMGGAFPVSTQGMSTAGSYMGLTYFNELAHKRMADPDGFAKNSGPLADWLRRTTSEADLREAGLLLDSQGFARDGAAMKRLLEIARPFMAEYRSNMLDTSSPLFQTAWMRNRPFRVLSWLAMTPLSLMSAAVMGVIEGYEKIGKARGGAKKRATLEFIKRATKFQGAAFLNGALRTAGQANTANLAIQAGLLVGAYPAIMAGAAAYGSYDPDEQAKEARWTRLKSALRDVERRTTSIALDAGDAVAQSFLERSLEPAKERGSRILRTATKDAAPTFKTLGRTLAAGQIYVPKVVPNEIMSDAERSVSGLPNFNNALDAGNMILPQVYAGAQTLKQSWDAANLALRAPKLGPRERVALGVGAVQPLPLPIPSMGEYLGKDLKMWKEQKRTRDTKAILEKEMEKVEALTLTPELIDAAVKGKVQKVVGSKKRKSAY